MTNIAESLYLRDKDLNKDFVSFYIYYTSLISSNKLRTVSDCEDSLERLNDLEKDIENSDIIPDTVKELWLDYVKEGIIICERDREDIRCGRNNYC